MKKQSVIVLGVESSCDDTACAVVRRLDTGHAEILSSVVFDQFDLHVDFGGVVPEIAARAHAERLDFCAKSALDVANLNLENMDAIAVTAGPGLIGGVLSGVAFAKGLAFGSGLPLIGVNHLAGHALTPRMTDNLTFPYLMLLVSGGHCQFLIVKSAIEFQRLGGTIDDAPGEAFDKTAKLLGLGYPGGPALEAEARLGDPNRFKFPRPLLDRDNCDMSFSGLKTAVRRQIDQLVLEQNGLYGQDIADISAGFQKAVADVLSAKTKLAMQMFIQTFPNIDVQFSVAGGVAANQEIRNALQDVSKECGFKFSAPPMKYCTDNGAMIAWVGIERLRLNLLNDFTLKARPRWPLDEKAVPMLGSGKKGAKA